MVPAYTVYVNGYYFDTLRSSEEFGDRPEPYRLHERALWTSYQLLKLGAHEIIITDKAKQIIFRTRRAAELKNWFQQLYPGMTSQLDQPVWTRFPHALNRL